MRRSASRLVLLALALVLLAATSVVAGAARERRPNRRTWRWTRLPWDLILLGLAAAAFVQLRSPSARVSTVAREIISPAILAKRLARPLIATKPSASIATMSPVSCQPPGGGSSTPGFSAR